ncbi:LSM domain-containing protein [Colletotrichum cuscutae]|uniref:LSM domain-containing protein n=1 Tax=Colletotrichum cuscutae TaxID=1209917 RepID=A0AAI9V5B4_9PEZI|nr:LSM domain-containing protein [Colletotrichum cuscutae]
MVNSVRDPYLNYSRPVLQVSIERKARAPPITAPGPLNGGEGRRGKDVDQNPPHHGRSPDQAQAHFPTEPHPSLFGQTSQPPKKHTHDLSTTSPRDKAKIRNQIARDIFEIGCQAPITDLQSKTIGPKPLLQTNKQTPRHNRTQPSGAMADRGSHRGGGRGGGGGGGNYRGGRGGGRGGGGGGGGDRGGAQGSGGDRERPKKENILDLSKYMDKQITVKFNGGREVTGTLKGYDALMNLVLDEVQEVMRGTCVSTFAFAPSLA